MPLDSGYVLIQPCVACWREPTAMSRLLRVSWLSAGRHSIPEKGTWTFRMDEAATGAQTGQTASQRARHRGSEDCCNTSCLPRAVLPEPKAEQPELRPQQPWAPAPQMCFHTGGPGQMWGRQPCSERSQEPLGHSLWLPSPVLWQAACVCLLRRPWGPRCCRQGPDHGDAPTALMLESLLTGLPCWAARDCAWPLVAHQPQPRVG